MSVEDFGNQEKERVNLRIRRVEHGQFLLEFDAQTPEQARAYDVAITMVLNEPCYDASPTVHRPHAEGDIDGSKYIAGHYYYETFAVDSDQASELLKKIEAQAQAILSEAF